MIQRLRCFLGQNSLPLGGPWAMSSIRTAKNPENREQELVALGGEGAGEGRRWGFDWINYSNMTHKKTSLEASRGSLNLSSNRPCSLESGCVELPLGREEVCHEYFVSREQSGVWRGWAGTSQDTEHTDTVTGLSTLLLLLSHFSRVRLCATP